MPVLSGVPPVATSYQLYELPLVADKLMTPDEQMVSEVMSSNFEVTVIAFETEAQLGALTVTE